MGADAYGKTTQTTMFPDRTILRRVYIETKPRWNMGESQGEIRRGESERETYSLAASPGPDILSLCTTLATTSVTLRVDSLCILYATCTLSPRW